MKNTIITTFLETCVLGLLIATSTTSLAHAAEVSVADQYSEKPIGITWDTNITQTGSMAYATRIAEEHGIEIPWAQNESVKEQMKSYTEAQKEIEGATAKGNIFYIKKGFLPSFVQVGFRTVKDQAEFRKVVMQRRSMYGVGNDRVKIEGREDKYSVVFKWGDGEGQGISTYFRHDDGVMFEANFEDIYEMNLPAPSYLNPTGARAKYDVLAEFNFKDIPKGYKDIAWSMLSTQTGPMLQQFDDEEDDVYDMRRAAGDLALNSLKPLIYDIERADFKLELIDDGQPLKFDLDLSVRDNSPLSKTLGEVAKGNSRFSGVINDDAALSLASTWNMPKGLQKLGRAAADFLRSQAEKEVNANEDARKAVVQLANVLDETCEKEKIDGFFKFGTDAAGEFVFYGGMQMDGTENLVQMMPKLLEYIPQVTPGQEQTENGTVFSVQIPEEFWRNDAGIPQDVIGFFPSRINLTFARSAMWFTIGREQSGEKIGEVIAASMNRTVDQVSGEQLLFNLDLTEWANGDRDSMPRRALAKYELMLDNMMDVSYDRMRDRRKKKKADGGNEPAKSEPSGSNLFAANKESRNFTEETLSGDGFARAYVNTSKKSIRVDGEVGDGMARYVVVRYLYSIGKMMRASQQAMDVQAEAANQDIEEARKSLQEAQDKAIKQAK